MNPMVQALLDQFAKDRDYRELAAGLEKMVTRGEGFFLVYGQLGNAYSQLGRDADAVAAFERAIALDPDVYLVQYQYGAALGRVGRYEEAIAAYCKAAALDKARSEPLANAGNCALVQGRWEEALQLYRDALSRDSKDYVAKIGLKNVDTYRRMSPEERAKLTIVMGDPPPAQ
jgi:tetratricopeptide (TPR) repeat protein